MLKVLCNFLIPGLGTVMMKKPITGLLQLICFVVAILLILSVFMSFLGLMLWAIDLVWALIVSRQWWRGREASDHFDLSLPVRRCDCGDSAQLTATAHRWDLYNAVSKYGCDTCGNSVEIIPAPHIGYMLSIGGLAVFMVVYFYIWRAHDPGIGIYSIVAVLALLQAAMTFSQLAPHGLYPVIKSGPEDVGARVRGAAFLKGMALPFLVIALFLGVAAILGFVHDYFFPKP